MPTLYQHHRVLVSTFGVGATVTLRAIAKALWPDAVWLNTRASNGGARIGARVAGGLAGRMVKRGMLSAKHRKSDLHEVVQYVIKPLSDEGNEHGTNPSQHGVCTGADNRTT